MDTKGKRAPARDCSPFVTPKSKIGCDLVKSLRGSTGDPLPMTRLAPRTPTCEQPQTMRHRPSDRGGVVMEYLFVSIFALVVSGAALSYVGNLLKERIKHMEDKLGLSVDSEFDFEF
jgi:hypothetical protein